MLAERKRSGAAVADHCQSDNLKVQTIGSVGLGYLHLVCLPLAHGKEEVEGSAVMRRRCSHEWSWGKQFGDLTGRKGVGIREVETEMHLLKADDDVLKNVVGGDETMKVQEKCHYRRDEPPSSGARKGSKSNERERGKKENTMYKAGRPGPLSPVCRDIRCRRQGKWAETGKGPTA